MSSHLPSFVGNGDGFEDAQFFYVRRCGNKHDRGVVPLQVVSEFHVCRVKTLRVIDRDLMSHGGVRPSPSAGTATRAGAGRHGLGAVVIAQGKPETLAAGPSHPCFVATYWTRCERARVDSPAARIKRARWRRAVSPPLSLTTDHVGRCREGVRYGREKKLYKKNFSIDFVRFYIRYI